MPINWQEIITTVLTTVGGGGVLLAAAAWLIKQVVSNRLALDAEKFKIEIKASADTEIERVEAYLTRASRVHERQLDILQRLYNHFYNAQGSFQRMTAAARIGGEISREKYESRVATEMESARDELSKGRLLIPPALAQQCDNFFEAVFQGRLDFSLAQNPMLEAVQQQTFWKSAAATAHQEVPRILKQIEEAARVVIHGEDG